VDAAHDVTDAGPRVLGKEAFLGDTGGTAHQAQDAAGHMRQDPVRDLRVKFRKPLLGDAGLRPQDSLGMGEADAGPLARWASLLARVRPPAPRGHLKPRTYWRLV